MLDFRRVLDYHKIGANGKIVAIAPVPIAHLLGEASTWTQAADRKRRETPTIRPDPAGLRRGPKRLNRMILSHVVPKLNL